MARPRVTPRLLTLWPYTEANCGGFEIRCQPDGADDAIEWLIFAAADFFLGDARAHESQILVRN